DVRRRLHIAGGAEMVDAEVDLGAAGVGLPELRDAGEGVERRQAVAVLALRAVADHLDHEVGSALELDEAPVLAAPRRRPAPPHAKAAILAIVRPLPETIVSREGSRGQRGPRLPRLPRLRGRYPRGPVGV